MSAIIVVEEEEEVEEQKRGLLVMASSAKWARGDENKRPPRAAPPGLRSGEQDKVLEVFKQYGEAPRHEAISRKVTKAVKEGRTMEGGAKPIKKGGRKRAKGSQ